MLLSEIYLSLLELIHKGGEVMWCIALLAIILWCLVFERLWYLNFGFKKDLETALNAKKKIIKKKSYIDHHALQAFKAKLHQKIRLNISLIKTLILLCPLLGLLGTVTGMIAVFEIIALDSMGDIRLMAGGISKATIPTMASMVISISGVFAHGVINKVAQGKSQLTSNSLGNQ